MLTYTLVSQLGHCRRLFAWGRAGGREAKISKPKHTLSVTYGSFLYGTQFECHGLQKDVFPKERKQI